MFPSVSSHVPSEISEMILTEVYLSIVAPLRLARTAWTVLEPFSGDFNRFDFRGLYRLRLVHRLWKTIIDNLPIFWSCMPLYQMTAEDFLFVVSQVERLPVHDLTVMVSGMEAIGMWVDLLRRQLHQRIRVFYLSLKGKEWQSVRLSLNHLALPRLCTLFLVDTHHQWDDHQAAVGGWGGPAQNDGIGE